jgi:hypothetical protein
MYGGTTSSLVWGTNSKVSRSFQERTPTRRRGRMMCVRIISAKRVSQVDNGSRESRTRIAFWEGVVASGGGTRTVFTSVAGAGGGVTGGVARCDEEGVRGV